MITTSEQISVLRTAGAICILVCSGVRTAWSSHVVIVDSHRKVLEFVGNSCVDLECGA